MSPTRLGSRQPLPRVATHSNPPCPFIEAPPALSALMILKNIVPMALSLQKPIVQTRYLGIHGGRLQAEHSDDDTVLCAMEEIEDALKG